MQLGKGEGSWREQNNAGIKGPPFQQGLGKEKINKSGETWVKEGKGNPLKRKRQVPRIGGVGATTP